MIETALSETGTPHFPLTLQEVDDCFRQIAEDRGAGSAGRKAAALQGLFYSYSADPDERRFLAHLLMGKLRQGALEGLVLGRSPRQPLFLPQRSAKR